MEETETLSPEEGNEEFPEDETDEDGL